MNPAAPIQPPLDDAERALAQRLRTHVEVLASLIGVRHMGIPHAIDATVAYIDGELASIGDRVEQQTYPVGQQQAINLVVERKGAKRPDEIVVLGAHYDSDPSTPGADDNASAVAVLIEAARLTLGKFAPRTIRFVAFANEEAPHFHMDTMGSRIYARQCRAKSENITGMLCLEMVGYYRTEPGSQKLPPGIPRFLRFAFPKRGNFLGAVGNMHSMRLGWSFRRGFKRSTKFPLFSISLPEKIREIRLSDNSSFWDAGYPALMLTDTSFLRNPHYHQPTDTPDTLDYERMARVTMGVAGGVLRCARGAGL